MNVPFFTGYARDPPVSDIGNCAYGNVGTWQDQNRQFCFIGCHLVVNSTARTSWCWRLYEAICRMSLLLIPIFILSITCIVLGIFRMQDRSRQFLIVLLGTIIFGISFPLVVVVLNSFTGGFIENQISALWLFAKRLAIADGDIYIGAGGLLLVVVSTILLVFQMLLARNDKTT